jgi:hypothetical protein
VAFGAIMADDAQLPGDFRDEKELPGEPLEIIVGTAFLVSSGDIPVETLGEVCGALAQYHEGLGSRFKTRGLVLALRAQLAKAANISEQSREEMVSHLEGTHDAVAAVDEEREAALMAVWQRQSDAYLVFAKTALEELGGSPAKPSQPVTRSSPVAGPKPSGCAILFGVLVAGGCLGPASIYSGLFS